LEVIEDPVGVDAQLATGDALLIRCRRYQVACGTPAAVQAALVPLAI
jgi:hypothetical protein